VLLENTTAPWLALLLILGLLVRAAVFHRVACRCFWLSSCSVVVCLLGCNLGAGLCV
jgi:hypothetical protein